MGREKDVSQERKEDPTGKFEGSVAVTPQTARQESGVKKKKICVGGEAG